VEQVSEFIHTSIFSFQDDENSNSMKYFFCCVTLCDYEKKEEQPIAFVEIAIIEVKSMQQKLIISSLHLSNIIKQVPIVLVPP
jgi:hypothetical protein